MPGEPARWTQEEVDAHMQKIRNPVLREKYIRETTDVISKSMVPRGRHMNKVEAAYDSFLTQQKDVGMIIRHRYESVTILLAPGCRYTPDFMVYRISTHGTGLLVSEFHEVKGTRKRKSGVIGPHIEDDARVKLLTAAKLYPEFTFKLVWLDRGRWQEETISK